MKKILYGTTDVPTIDVDDIVLNSNNQHMKGEVVGGTNETAGARFLLVPNSGGEGYCTLYLDLSGSPISNDYSLRGMKDPSIREYIKVKSSAGCGFFLFDSRREAFEWLLADSRSIRHTWSQ